MCPLRLGQWHWLQRNGLITKLTQKNISDKKREQVKDKSLTAQTERRACGQSSISGICLKNEGERDD